MNQHKPFIDIQPLIEAARKSGLLPPAPDPGVAVILKAEHDRIIERVNQKHEDELSAYDAKVADHVKARELIAKQRDAIAAERDGARRSISLHAKKLQEERERCDDFLGDLFKATSDAQLNRDSLIAIARRHQVYGDNVGRPSKADRLEATVQRLVKQNADLAPDRNAAKQLSADRDALRNQNADLTTALADMTADRDSYKDQRDDAVQRFNDSRAQVIAMREDLNAHKGRIIELEADVSGLHKENEAARQEAVELRNVVESQTTRLMQQYATILKLEATKSIAPGEYGEATEMHCSSLQRPLMVRCDREAGHDGMHESGGAVSVTW